MLACEALTGDRSEISTRLHHFLDISGFTLSALNPLLHWHDIMSWIHGYPTWIQDDTFSIRYVLACGMLDDFQPFGLVTGLSDCVALLWQSWNYFHGFAYPCTTLAPQYPSTYRQEALDIFPTIRFGPQQCHARPTLLVSCDGFLMSFGVCVYACVRVCQGGSSIQCRHISHASMCGVRVSGVSAGHKNKLDIQSALVQDG